MKNILVPIDFSKASRNAAKYAVSLAKHFDAAVILINAIPPAIIDDDSFLAFAMTTQAEILEANQQLMEKEVRILSKEYPGQITGLVQEGAAAGIIRKMAETNQADLVVMGMKGKGKSNSVFGSTTTAVIRRFPFPVFVIPEKAGYKPISTITYASDFDRKIAMSRYKVLLELAGKFNAQVRILNVQKSDSSMDAAEAIGKMRTSIVFSKLNHRFYNINEKNIEEGIHKFIEKKPTNILAMVAHKHNLFERMFGKVHTKEMSYQTKIPLLVLQSK